MARPRRERRVRLGALPKARALRVGLATLRERLMVAARPLTARLIAAEFERLYYARRAQTWENTRWLGVAVQKLPLDLWVMQEILHETRPELLIETGANQGGSALYWATIFDAMGQGEVVTIDVDLSFVDERVPAHPRVTLIEGSSTEPAVLARVRELAAGKRVAVMLDSDHSAAHVHAELEALAPLVSVGCYLIVEDTNLGGHPVWPGFGPGPMEALDRWLPGHPEFTVDRSREKLLATFNPRGFLLRRAE